MFRLLLFALLCGPLFAADGQLPQIVCRDARGQSFPLDLERFEMKVAIHEDLAETTLTLTFRNDTSRQLEGDFLLPLPPNSNISSYALEVNGAFREAVAVEKERAKLAYETIKRRGIDPGIVEKEPDNLYRTRIFPIEPRSTKSVRISYLEYLSINGPPPYRPTYRYPFNFTSEVGTISIRIEEPNEALIDHPDLKFIETSEGAMQATLQNQTLAGELTIESKDPHRPSLLLSKQTNKQQFGYLTLSHSSLHTAESPLATQHNIPKDLKIIWDASRSMKGTDFTKVHAYLDAFFEKCPEVMVQLILLRNTAQEAGTFFVKEGDWSLLKKALEAISYDGASDLQNFLEKDHDLTFLVTDGKITRWPSNIAGLVPAQPIVALLTGNHHNTTLNQLTIRSGGHTLSLQNTPTKAAITQSFQKNFHVSSSQRGITILPLPSNKPHVSRYLLRGRSLANANLQVAFGKSTLQPLVIENSSAPFDLLNRLSGIATLSLLEDQAASPFEIIEHCKKHTLASDHTSLIVLERFQDHITFRIPPPEPDLLVKYQGALRKADSRMQKALTQNWAHTLRLHRHHFPGAEFLVLEDLQRLRTFTEAQDQAFDPKDLDPQVTQSLADWKKEAHQLLKKQQMKPIDEEWLKETSALRAKAAELGKLTAAPRDTVAISVRGFVKSPGTFRYSSPITLKEAAEKSRPFSQDNLGRVALYRSGTKTVYNTLSKNYQDLSLLPGDMVVVEELHRRWADSDPFFGGDLPSLENEPAVISAPPKEPIPLQIPTFSSDLSGESHAFGNPTSDKSQASPNEPIPIALRALTLHKKGQVEEAQQQLSNLRELFPGNLAARRVEGFVLAHWGDAQAAESIYHQLISLNSEDSLTTSLLAQLMVTRDETAEALEVYQTFIDGLTQYQSLPATSILLSDRNNLLTNSSGNAQQEPLPQDLRIVITNLHPAPSFAISVTDPFGLTSDRHKPSLTGVLIKSTIGLTEVIDREASKGTYKLAARCNRKQLLEITIYRNFGKAEENVTRRIVSLPASGGSELTLLESIEIQ
ncbi:MAG: VIT domain-containing protein [Roseibacillus sp.]